MKKIILAFSVIISTLTVGAQPVPAPQDCNINTEMNDFVKTLFDPGCLNKGDKKAQCDCLEAEKATNFLVSELDKKENIKKYQRELATKRTQYFWQVYTQMTHGAALQKQIMFGEELKGKEEEKVVGCPPSELVADYKKNLQTHVEKMEDKRRTALETVTTELQACLANRGKCNVLKHQKKLLEDEIGLSSKDEVRNIEDNTRIANRKSDSYQQLTMAKSWYERSQLPPAEKTEKLKKVKCYLLKLDISESADGSEYERNGCGKITGEIQPSRSISGASTATTFQFENVKLKNDLTDVEICDQSCAEIQDFIAKFKDEKNQVRVAAMKTVNSVAANMVGRMSDIKIKDCKSDKLCQSFEDTNNNALSALQENFQQDGNNCVTYPEFLLRKGMPGSDFMQELSSMPPESIADFLTTPKVLKTKADKQRLKFLRSNPIVAKLAIDPANRKVMAQALQNFSKGVADKPYSKRLDDYLNFMKTTVKDLMKNEDYKSQQQYICKRMINSYTAIQVATDLPPLKEDLAAFPLTSAIRDCKIELNNAVSQTSTIESLEMNDLFREVEDLTGDAGPEKSDEERFEEVNKKKCVGYSDFLKTCNQDIESCRQEFLSKNKENLDEQKVYEKWKTITNPENINFNRVANESRSSYQDDSFKRWWTKKVGSKMSKDPFPYKGEEAEFSYDQKMNEAKMASTEVPSSFKSSEFDAPKEQAPVAQASAPVQPVTNPGQIIPSYSTQPIFDPSKLVPGQSVTKAITNFNELPSMQKIEGLKEVQEYVKEKKDSFEESDLEEKLAETNEKIAEEKAHQEEIEKKLAQNKTHRGTQPTFNTAVNQTNHAPTVGNTGGSSATSSTSFGRANGLSNTSGGFGAVNDALKNKEEVSNRNPASIKEPVDLTIKTGVVAPEELKGKIEIQAELTAASSSEFVSISQNITDLEKYLEANLDKKDIGQGKIISIVNPGTQGPVQHLIFRVNVENGKYVVQSMPANVKVQRSSTLDRLKLNLKQFTKKST